MNVYVVFHADIEDDRYVRAVCSTRKRAEEVSGTPAPCPDAHEHRGYPGVPTDAHGCDRARDHFTRGGTEESLCCGVEEWTVDAATPT